MKRGSTLACSADRLRYNAGMANERDDATDNPYAASDNPTPHGTTNRLDAVASVAFTVILAVFGAVLAVSMVGFAIAMAWVVLAG